MVPLFARSSDICIQYTKSISGMFKCQVLQYFNDLRVIFLTLVVIHRAKQRIHFTGPANRKIIILYDLLCQFPLFAGPQPFFDMTSFKFAWSMLSSANISFNREYSYSRSLSRLTSKASIPPHFDFEL
jgi:hypothetical protein